MTYRSRFSVALVVMSLTTVLMASELSAQVLPRNRVQREANQAAQNAERAANARATADQDAAAGAAVEGQRGQTRVRTETNADVSQSVRTTTRSDMSILRSTQLVGTMVSVPGNRRLGKITDIVFNENGCIWYVVVDMNGRMAPVPWHVGNYDFQNRVFILDNFEVNRIDRIPTFTTWQQFSDDKFVTQVNEFFGAQADAGVNTRTDAAIRATETERATSRTTRESNQQDTRSQQNRSANQDQDKARVNGKDTEAEVKTKSDVKSDTTKKPIEDKAAGQRSNDKSDEPALPQDPTRPPATPEKQPANDSPTSPPKDAPNS